MEELNKIHQFINLNLGIEIKTKGRKREVSYGRFLFFALARRCTKLSLEKIGDYMNRDHVSVLLGVKKFNDTVILYDNYCMLYDMYVFSYLDGLIREDNENKKKIESLIEEEKVNSVSNNRIDSIIRLREKEIVVSTNAISLLRENANKLQEENAVLKKALAKKTPFLKEYYKLTSKEQITVQERLKLIIKLMPSNQVRKEEFEIISCAQ